MIPNAKAYKNLLLALQNRIVDKRKNFVFGMHKPSNTIVMPFIRETGLWFRFIWTSATVTTSNGLNSSKFIDINMLTRNDFESFEQPQLWLRQTIFLRGTLFVDINVLYIMHLHELRSTEYLIHLQSIYGSEFKELTIMNFFCFNTQDFTRKTNSFFYIYHPLKTVLRFFTRETCLWLRFILQAQN